MKEPLNVATFRSICADLSELYAAKNAAYNNSFGESVQRYGMVAAITRISDKFHRAENLLIFNKGETNFESAEDTLLDLASYAIMTVIELRKSKHQE